MTDREEAEQIQATQNKTYAYFNAVLCSLTSGNIMLFVLSCIYTLTYSSDIDEVTNMPVDPDYMDGVIVFVFIALVCLLLSVFFAWRWFRRIRALEKKLATVVTSLVIYVVLIPILGYLSLVTYGVILWK